MFQKTFFTLKLQVEVHSTLFGRFQVEMQHVLVMFVNLDYKDKLIDQHNQTPCSFGLQSVSILDEFTIGCKCKFLNLHKGIEEIILSVSQLGVGVSAYYF